MLVIVIDNTEEQLLRLIDLVEESFPHATVLPAREEPRIFTNWEEVFSFVRGVSREQLTVLCLDVGLTTEDYPDAIRGLKHANSIRAMRRDWIFVAYTRFGARIISEAEYTENFEGMIEKAAIDGKNRTERIRYVKSSIEAAIRRKNNAEDVLPVGAKIVDSMGMRVFRAAFGDNVIAEIIRNEGAAWCEIEFEAITSGYSGAFMLNISGQGADGFHSLVLKVARDERAVEREIRAQREFLGQLGPLAGHLAVLDSECVRLTEETGVYYRQAMIDGTPLLELLKGGKAFGRELPLKRVVDLCLNVCSGVNAGRTINRAAQEVFALTAIDIGRVEGSVRFLIGLGGALRAHDLWKLRDVDVDEAGAGIVGLARGWNDWYGLQLELVNVVQHGDLNPGNVIVAPDGSPILIDLARLGHWPVGYDLGRLSLMLRLRLVDHKGSEDWLPFGLSDWLLDGVGITDVDRTRDFSCAEAVYCDQRFGDFLAEIPLDRKSLIAYGYRLGLLWDLMKVISYQDASPYKRMWAMLEAWRLKARLEEERSKL